MLSPLPRRSDWVHRLLASQPYQPSPIWQSGRPAHRPFRGLFGVHLRYGLHTRAATVFRGTLNRRLQPFRYLHSCSGCFRLEPSPGGACTHWKSAAFSRRTPYAVDMADGPSIRSKAILIASGAQYRMPDFANLSRFLGRGVYYAATHLEATLCAAEDVVVVGGGNSAGQAAVFLAGSCRHVHMLVRSDGLAESMSQYLIHRIQDTPNIILHTRTQLTAFEGSDRLERVSWMPRNGESVVHDLKHVFLMTGAQPHTRWLQGCVVLDDHGFVKTGPDLGKEQLAGAHWNLPRPPYLLESSVPGVFAAGDVRAGSVKRIASAVGEGSICVQFVHRVLREFAEAGNRPTIVAA